MLSQTRGIPRLRDDVGRASHFYSSQHETIHYQRRGVGDPLVLIHNVYPGASHEGYSCNIGGESTGRGVFG